MNFPDVLVLGATGRIGTVLRQCWPAERARWQTRRPMSGPDWVQFDPLANTSALYKSARGCRTILCLAGVTNARAAAGGDLQDNLALARMAIMAGAEAGARVLLMSSAAVYGKGDGVLGENRPLAPISDYGRIKAVMEAEGAELGARLGVDVSALRVGNIAGLDAILGGWKPGFALDRLANGQTPLRSYIGPASLARILRDLCSKPELPDVMNIAAPSPVEMGALLDAAGLAWIPRAAPQDVVPQVHLSTERLSGLSAPAPSAPEDMVAEWRLIEPHMRHGSYRT